MFIFEIGRAAEALKDVAKLFNCSYTTAWKKYTHPLITEAFTFEEVMDYIENTE